MATGSSLTQNHSRSQSEIQGNLHNGAQRINPENRVGSGFRIIPEQYFSGVENINDFLENIDNNLAVIEDKATDYAHLKKSLSEQFPVVRNRSELETRFYSSSQRRDQQPSDFIYELLKIHKVLKLEKSEEKLIDHVVSRLEPQILDYVEVRHPQNTANLLQIVDKYEERFVNRQIGALWDTGAEKYFISEEVYRKYFSYRPRQKTKDRVVTAQGAPCSHLGRVE
ncbi:uncharacterized protein TNCV_454001 [Trichonephila clavipes]|nr:uncharacterized protein TNCV_454001 [Trichonephila clavipes]